MRINAVFEAIVKDPQSFLNISREHFNLKEIIFIRIQWKVEITRIYLIYPSFSVMIYFIILSFYHFIGAHFYLTQHQDELWEKKTDIQFGSTKKIQTAFELPVVINLNIK